MLEAASEGKSVCFISLDPWVSWFLFIWVSASRDDLTLKFKTFSYLMEEKKGIKIFANRLLDTKAHVYGRLTIPLFEHGELLNYIKKHYK